MAGQLLCASSSNIYYIWFPLPGHNFFTSTKYKFPEENTLIDMSWLNVEYYNGFELNDHHITTLSYYFIVLPFLDKFLKFGYDINDFDLVPTFEYNSGKAHTVSYLTPKEDLRFTLSIDGKTVSEEGGFNTLHNMETDWGDEGPGATTKYHKLYRGTHQCSSITNPRGRGSIIISGDSMLAPVIPILACYFNVVTYLDNRTDISHKEYYDGKIFDYVILEFWEGNPPGKVTEDNLI